MTIAKSNNNKKGVRGKSMSVDEILTTEFREPDWIVNNLLPPGLTILAGRQKAGKSYLALQLAKAVTGGEQILGQQATTGAVLYFALEDSYKRLQSRMNQQHWELGRPVTYWSGSALRYYLMDQDIRLAEFIDNSIDWDEYKLIVIDTLSKMANLQGSYNQNKTEDMYNLLIPLQELANNTGISILLIDHNRKMTSYDNPNPLIDVLGSTAKTATADTVWSLYPKPNSTKAKLLISGRDIEEQEFVVCYHKAGGIWLTEDEGKVTELDWKVYDVIDQLGPLTNQEAASRMKKNPATVYNCQTRLINAGLLYKTEDKKLTTISPKNNSTL